METKLHRIKKAISWLHGQSIISKPWATIAASLDTPEDTIALRSRAFISPHHNGDIYRAQTFKGGCSKPQGLGLIFVKFCVCCVLLCFVGTL